jgi:membrane protease YdiL (CAAX protease family)
VAAGVTPLLAVAVLVAVNLLDNRFAPRWYLLTSLGGTAALLGLYAASGTPWALAGLGAGSVRRGLPWAALLVAIVAAGYALAAVLPPTRPVFRDRRVGGAGPADAAYQVLVRIPIGTVLIEEVGFRGVLFGLLWDARGIGAATIGAAVLFGLWHVLPAAGLVRNNPVAGRVFDRRRALLVPVTVLVTGLAGVALTEAQRRTGSLLVPFALHWAVNGLGWLTAWVVGWFLSGSAPTEGPGA